MIEVARATEAACIAAALAIRQEVFVEEHGVPLALEVDAYEQESWHFLVRRDGAAVATGRFRCKGSLLKFERIATLPAARGGGLGSALMVHMSAAAAQHFPAHLPYMHAQAGAVE